MQGSSLRREGSGGQEGGGGEGGVSRSGVVSRSGGGRGGRSMVEAAEGRVTVGSGVMEEIVVVWNASYVETLAVNGSVYGAALLRESAGGGGGGAGGGAGGGGVCDASASSSLSSSSSTPYSGLHSVRAANKEVKEVHMWKEGSGRDSKLRFLRLVFSDGSDLEVFQYFRPLFWPSRFLLTCLTGTKVQTLT